MGSAASTLAAPYQSLTTMAHGADQDPAHQTQGRGLALPSHAVDTREVAREVHEVCVIPWQGDQAILPLRLMKIYC